MALIAKSALPDHTRTIEQEEMLLTGPSACGDCRVAAAGGERWGIWTDANGHRHCLGCDLDLGAA